MEEAHGARSVGRGGWVAKPRAHLGHPTRPKSHVLTSPDPVLAFSWGLEDIGIINLGPWRFHPISSPSWLPRTG